MPNRETRRKMDKTKQKLSAGIPTYELTTVKTNRLIPDSVHRLLVNYTVRRLAKVDVK